MSNIEKLNQILSTIFYLIWIPLGIFLIAGIIFLVVANPLGQLGQLLQGGGPGGGFPGGGPGQGGRDNFPSQEQIEQFQKQGGPGGFNEPGR